MDEALIAVRAVQLASTAITAGVLIFPVVVAGPVFRAAAEPGIADVFTTWNGRMAWTGLALIALSGIAWLLLQTSAMSGRPLGEALADGLVDSQELTHRCSTYLSVPVKTVYRWRLTGAGPRGAKVGRYVRFRRADVDSWLERQLREERATGAR